MMDFWINEHELSALSGLPYLQRIAYLQGIRPYMDRQTNVVGIKRRISYQSLAEALYVEPHQGISELTPSRQQLRRALKGLERSGLIKIQSIEKQLILKCLLASRPFSVQNKADTNQTQQPDMCRVSKNPDETWVSADLSQKADTAEITKADTPLLKNNYIYLLFEKFWSLYPEKKSQNTAWIIFQNLNPDETLCDQIIIALAAQINHRNTMQANGLWVPPWKYPANWLEKQCWKDELSTDMPQEKQHAEFKKNRRNTPSKDMFWIPDESECVEEQPATNVIEFKRYASPKQAY